LILCIRDNPVPDTFLYFAYGSNMLAERLRARCPSARPLGMAIAPGWRLVFTQKGGDGSAKATLEPAADHTVHGALFEIDLNERPALDVAEDASVSYERIDEFEVFANGAPLRLTTYVGLLPVENGVLPYDWYRALCMAGARQHHLPQEVIGALVAHPFTPDPDPASPGRTKAIAALENAGFGEDGTFRAA
jgi:Gamma-glutamyl cyclotransferase, AIG2-like